MYNGRIRWKSLAQGEGMVSRTEPILIVTDDECEVTVAEVLTENCDDLAEAVEDANILAAAGDLRDVCDRILAVGRTHVNARGEEDVAIPRQTYEAVRAAVMKAQGAKP